MPSPGSNGSSNGSAALNRRNFLTAAALGGAAIVGASALGAFDADAAFAAPTKPLDPAVAESAFAEGLITGRDGNLLTVSGSDGVTHRVQLTNATSVWKLHPADVDAVELGDGMYGRGVSMPDGTIAADAVWVNIVNLVGDVTSIGSDRLDLLHAGHTVVGRIARGSTVARVGDRAPSTDLSVLRLGQQVQLLGAWRPADDSVDVARISMAG